MVVSARTSDDGVGVAVAVGVCETVAEEELNGESEGETAGVGDGDSNMFLLYSSILMRTHTRGNDKEGQAHTQTDRLCWDLREGRQSKECRGKGSPKAVAGQVE